MSLGNKAPKPPSFIANFDSATAMTRALGAYLSGRDFPALGLSPALKVPAARANLLPEAVRRQLYIFSGWNESVPPKKLDDVDAEELSDWVAAEYPDRQYPAVAIGSSNGAATHLWAAMGIPWLPQTFLVPVRQAVDPDDPVAAMEMGREPGAHLLERNPDLQLHHMHDANQDRLMVRVMTYFRVKRRRLGARYEKFLTENLPRGGTIIVTECDLDWGVTRIGDRHVFQHGAIGGLTESEYHSGSERLAQFLADIDAPVREWENPPITERAPEAEWGFEPSLLDDIRRVAEENDYRILRLRFPAPQSISPMVADLYRWWYRQRRIPANRLLVESFIVMEPWWMLRTGSVPFWMEFNMAPSLDEIHRYLDDVDPYDEIGLMLFNHGVDAVGLPRSEEWASVLERARSNGYWVGADPSEFPMDYAQFARYHTDIQKIPARYSMPPPLGLGQLESFLAEHGSSYDVDLEADSAVGAH